MMPFFIFSLKCFLLSTLFITTAFAEAKRKPSSLDITSVNEILFYAKKDLDFSDFGKIAEYQGELYQINESVIELSISDLYKFPKEPISKMNVTLCNKYIDKIFGPKNKRTLALNDSLLLFDAPVGKSCEFKLTDSYAHAKIPYRFGIIGFIHGRLTSLIWNLERDPSTESITKLKSFWISLK